MNNYFYHYVVSYFNYLKDVRNYSNNTIITYRNTFLEFIHMLKTEEKIDINNLLITDFSSELIFKYITYLKEVKNNKAITINNKLAALKSFVKFLKAKNINTLEKCIQIENIKPLKVSQKVPDYYSIEEIDYIISAIDLEKPKGLLNLTVIIMLYECALRVGELCSLKRKDIIFEGKTISVFVEKSKNGMSRTIPMDIKSSNIVKKYLNENKMDDDDYLFHNKDNTPYTRYGIYKMLERIIIDVKKSCKNNTYFSKNFHPHGFRHSRATHMLDAGIDLVTIKEFLGHKSLSSTVIYLHLTKRKEEEILNKNMLKKKVHMHRSKKEIEDLEKFLINLG